MTTKTEYAPGTPSWVDLGTTDTAAAKAFYGPLFGWEFEDQSVDGAVVYTLAKLGGRNAAGLMEQPPMQIIPGPSGRAKITAHPGSKAVNRRKNP